MSETKLSKEIRDALTDAGIWAMRINSGKVPVRGGFMHLAPTGTPDVLVIHPYGWLEVKGDSPTSEEQVKFRERAAKSGVRHAEVRSVEDALRTVLSWR